MITKSMIDCWRTNYGLDIRAPSEAMKWWHDNNSAMAPAGAVAALGVCIDAIERQRTLLADWMRFASDVMPSDAAGMEWMDGLRARTEREIAK